jgi:hypothetical protein
MQHGGDNVLPTVYAFMYDKNLDAVIAASRDYELGKSNMMMLLINI